MENGAACFGASVEWSKYLNIHKTCLNPNSCGEAITLPIHHSDRSSKRRVGGVGVSQNLESDVGIPGYLPRRRKGRRATRSEQEKQNQVTHVVPQRGKGRALALPHVKALSLDSALVVVAALGTVAGDVSVAHRALLRRAFLASFLQIGRLTLILLTIFSGHKETLTSTWFCRDESSYLGLDSSRRFCSQNQLHRVEDR